MTGLTLRKTVVISVVLAAIALVVRAVRGGPVPALAPTRPPGAPWPALSPEPADGPDWTGPTAAPVDAVPVVPAGGGDEDGPAWVEASDALPPASHQVKAKLGSGIYHLPGMMNYERTRADRYYRSAADAETDGLRAAKR